MEEKSNIYYYCLKSKDVRSQKVGAFIYHESKQDFAISPVFSGSIELFRWARENNFSFNPYDRDLSICYSPSRMKKIVKSLYTDTNNQLVYRLHSVQFTPPEEVRPKIFTDAEIEAARNYYLGKSESRKNKLKLKSYTPAPKPDESLKIADNDDFIEKVC